MAGSITSRTEELVGNVKKIAWVWVSDGASGNVSAATDGQTSNAFNGAIIRLVTVPAAAGAAPTDNYDVTVLDEDGTDVLMSAGADRDTANTEQVLASSLGCVANDKLTLGVANAGNAKGGTVYLYIR